MPAVTEASNPRTRDLDRLDTLTLLTTIVREDEAVASAVRAALPQLERACEALVATLSAGGRWLNVGAGTSGRIGVLDAAEIPPTFGLEPARVQGLIAGGEAALRHAVEGAEDDAESAVRDLCALEFGGGDALVALSASGTTPYALGASAHARSLGAVCIGITCAPESPLVCAVDIPIVTEVGPEVISGSTRMKGGLAQKMILHTLSTAVMVQLGRVRGNAMTGMRAVNRKLRDRAERIVTELADCTLDEARDALDAADGSVEEALEALKAR